MDKLPPFPVDDQTLDLLMSAIHPGPEAERSSLHELCDFYGQMAGNDPNAVETVEGGIYVMADPQYHPNDVIAALVEEIRRLRATA